MRALIELAHDEAWEILVEYRDVLDNLVLELIEKETLSKADMARICARVIKRPPLAPFNGFGKRHAVRPAAGAHARPRSGRAERPGRRLDGHAADRSGDARSALGGAGSD